MLVAWDQKAHPCIPILSTHLISSHRQPVVVTTLRNPFQTHSCAPIPYRSQINRRSVHTTISISAVLVTSSSWRLVPDQAPKSSSLRHVEKLYIIYKCKTWSGVERNHRELISCLLPEITGLLPETLHLLIFGKLLSCSNPNTIFFYFYFFVFSGLMLLAFDSVRM